MYGNTVARGEAKEPSSFERHAKVLEPSIPGEGVGMGVRVCGHQPLTLVMSGPQWQGLPVHRALPPSHDGRAHAGLR